MELIKRLEEVGLSEFAKALEPEEGIQESEFIVDSVSVPKVPHIPYVKIAQGNRYAIANLVGHYVMRVERKVKGTVEIEGVPYIDLGKETEGICIGVARTKAYFNGKNVRFIPQDGSTPVPAEWIGKLVTVTYVALYFPKKKAIGIVEGVRSRRRITDAVIQALQRKPAFYELRLTTELVQGEKGEFIAPKVEGIKEVKATEELVKLRKLVHDYFIFRIESTRELMKKLTGTEVLKEELEEPPIKEEDFDEEEEVPF